MIELKSRCFKAILSSMSIGESISCLFQPLSATNIPWLVNTSLHCSRLASSDPFLLYFHISVSSVYQISLCFSLLRTLVTVSRACLDNTGSFTHLKILSLIISLKIFPIFPSIPFPSSLPSLPHPPLSFLFIFHIR